MIVEILDKKPGGGTGQISVGLAGKAVEIWTLLADGFDYDTEDIRGSGELPIAYQSYHPKNSRLLLRPIDIVQDDDNPALFTCTLTWESQPLTPSEKEQEIDNPLARPARAKIKTIREKEVKHRDKYGKKKLNSAGDLFDPPIESSTSFLQIMIRKNVADLPDWVFDYIDCVNSTPFSIEGRPFPAYRACIVDIDLDEKENDGGVEFRKCVIEIHLKKPRLPTVDEDEEDVPGPWQTEQLNEGLHELVVPSGDPTGKIRQRIMVDTDDDSSDAKQPAASPVLLDLDGRKLDPVTVDNATYIIFDDHEYRDFNEISFIWADA